MSGIDSGKRADAPKKAAPEQAAAQDNKYGRSSAEATDLTDEARQQARKKRALQRQAKPPRQG